MAAPPVIEIENLSHRYGDKVALAAVRFEVAAGEVFGLLGPNGGGKTTLFRVLSTALPVQAGRVLLCGCDVSREPDAVRRHIGVTFQSPSLDRKLTVEENLVHQGHLYGLSGRSLRSRMDELLSRFGLTDRRGDRVESLSGGLQRRVEIAKSLLHAPRLLLLDEPSTGLDPGSRLDLGRYLRQLSADEGVTVLLTTHLMEEAEHCDRLAILDRGQLVACDTPGALRSAIGGDCVVVQTPRPEVLAPAIAERFSLSPQVVDGQLRIEVERGAEFLRGLIEAFGPEIMAVSWGKPTLEDVFVHLTGHRFQESGESGVETSSGAKRANGKRTQR